MNNNFINRMNDNNIQNKNNNMHYMINNNMNDKLDTINLDNRMGNNMNNISFEKRMENNIMGNNMNNIINNSNIQNLDNQMINQEINPIFHNNNQMNFNQNQNQMQNEIVTNNNNCELIKIGKGLNNKDIKIINESTFTALNKREDPFFKAIIKRVKSIIGRDWVIFAYTNGLKGYDFSVRTYDEDKIISYSVDCFRFEVIKIRD